MNTTTYTIDAQEMLGEFVERAGKSFLTVRTTDVFGEPTALKITLDDVAEFYNSISLYVQPSRTEGFGCEVLEAQAHNRAAICSNAAGAVDMAVGIGTYEAGNVEELCEVLTAYKTSSAILASDAKYSRNNAEENTWDKIRERYKALWKSLL